MTHEQIKEYLKEQYLECKEEWYNWSCESDTLDNPKFVKSCRRFANEALAQANMLETIARDVYGMNLFEWYLDQL